MAPSATFSQLDGAASSWRDSFSTAPNNDVRSCRMSSVSCLLQKLTLPWLKLWHHEKVWRDIKIMQGLKKPQMSFGIYRWRFAGFLFVWGFFCFVWVFFLFFMKLSFPWSNVYIWGCHLSETCIQSLARNAEWSIPPASFPNLCCMQRKLSIACLSYAGTWSIKIYVAEELVWACTFQTHDSFCSCCARGWHNKVKLSPLTWSAVSTKSVLGAMHKWGIVYKYCRKFRLWLRSVKLMHFLRHQCWGFPKDQNLFFMSW